MKKDKFTTNQIVPLDFRQTEFTVIIEDEKKKVNK